MKKKKTSHLLTLRRGSGTCKDLSIYQDQVLVKKRGPQSFAKRIVEGGDKKKKKDNKMLFHASNSFV